jgi:hypothetical protein
MLVTMKITINKPYIERSFSKHMITIIKYIYYR